jgi:NAD(P)-dependent dehydrogenase (short-subunit alcohol dehydrogenase family)
MEGAIAGTIFITGVSSGIGAATARLFAERGWNVVGTVRRSEDHAAWNEVPNVRLLLLDVTDERAVSCIAGQAFEQFGRIDVVVNNAGYFQMGPLETSTMEQIRAQYEANVFGLIGVTKSFLPCLREKGAGLYVNIASTRAESGYPFGSVYSSTKGAVALLTEALNVELAAIGLGAKAVLPGLHATRIFTKVEVAPEVPESYRSLLARFVRMQGSVRGSAPEVAAKAVWQAVTNGRDDRVRYYAGPDAVSIPFAKRVMGAAGYWRFFRKTLLEGPGTLTRLMTPQGTAEVAFGENVLAMQAQPQ